MFFISLISLGEFKMFNKINLIREQQRGLNLNKLLDVEKEKNQKILREAIETLKINTNEKQDRVNDHLKNIATQINSNEFKNDAHNQNQNLESTIEEIYSVQMDLNKKLAQAQIDLEKRKTQTIYLREQFSSLNDQLKLAEDNYPNLDFYTTLGHNLSSYLSHN